MYKQLKAWLISFTKELRLALKKERAKAKARKYYQDNKEKFRTRNRLYYRVNREKLLEYSKEYYLKNKHRKKGEK